jgi:hypothetical protein
MLQCWGPKKDERRSSHLGVFAFSLHLHVCDVQRGPWLSSACLTACTMQSCAEMALKMEREGRQNENHVQDDALNHSKP